MEIRATLNKEYKVLTKYKNVFCEILVALFFLFLCSTITTIPDYFGLWEYLDFVHKSYFVFNLLFGLKIALDAFEEKRFPLGAILLITFAGIAYSRTDNTVILTLAFAICSCKNLNFKTLITKIFITLSVFYITVIILCFSGVLQDFSHERDGIIRHAYGFCYPTTLFTTYLSLVLMLIYIRGKKITYFELIGILAVAIILFIATDGRLSFILVCLITLLMTIYKIFKIDFEKYKDKKFIIVFKKMTLFLPIFLLVISIIFSLLYKLDLSPINWLDTLLSGRIKYGANALYNYPITLLGNKIEWYGWGGFGYRETTIDIVSVYNYVDNGYLRSLFDYGIILSLFALVGYTYVLYKSNKNNDIVLTSIIIVVLIWSYVEPVFFDASMNTFILFLAPMLKKLDIPFNKVTI